MTKKDTCGLGTYACVFNRGFTKVLLLKRNAKKRKMWGATWGNVGGKVEFGETSRQACAREMREEIGLSVRPSDLILMEVREFPHFRPHVFGISFIYAVSISERSRIRLNAAADTPESDAYQWFDIDRLPDSMLDTRRDMVAWARAARMIAHRADKHGRGIHSRPAA